jgi:hypothetical protein
MILLKSLNFSFVTSPITLTMNHLYMSYPMKKLRKWKNIVEHAMWANMEYIGPGRQNQDHPQMLMTESGSNTRITTINYT